MEKAIIIAAHPDDAEFAMGGTIAKMIESGWDVIIVDLTDGEPTPFGSKQLREKETKKANQILGIKNRICLEMPNRYLQATLENRRKLAEILRLYRPDLLFGPAMPDHHPDHIEAAKLTKGARFEAKFEKTNLQGIPHWIPKEYGYYSICRHGIDKPSFVVDVTDLWDKKIKAIQVYQSQIRNISSTNPVPLLEKAEVICRFFGQCIGCKYGEPFVGNELLGVKQIDLLGDLY